MFLKKIDRQDRGFTIIELLVTISIMMIVSGVALYNYRRFDQNVAVKGQVSEISLALRQAQLDATNGRELRGVSKLHYGVEFTRSSKSYIYFGDTTLNGLYSPSGSPTELVTSFVLRPGYLMDICAGTGPTSVTCNLSTLTALFASSTFHTTLTSGATSYSYAEIRVSTSTASPGSKIKLWTNGLIDN